jgi:hypothetical protein
LAATLLCAACVPLLVVLLVRWLFGVPLSAYRPVLSDEIYYWHESLTFARAGLHGGYYTLQEVTNSSGVTPFGAHGAGFVMLYGLAASVFEWHRHSVLVMNLVVIAGACWIWAAFAPVTTRRIWLSILLFGTFWQMVFWASTGMQESFHHAGAIVMAVLFARALSSPPSAWLTACGGATLCLLALVRPTWIIVMPLFALVTSRQSTRTRAVAAVTASLVIGAMMLMIFNRTVAPYTGGFSFVAVFSRSAEQATVLSNLLFNLRLTVTFSEYDDLEILHRIQYGGFLVGALAFAVVLKWRAAGWRTRPFAHLAVAATTMAVMLGLMLTLYSLTNCAEHRVLSAFLLFGVLLTLAAPGRIPVFLATALIASNVVTAGTFRRVFEAKRQEQFVWDRRGINALEAAMTTHHIAYRHDLSRWCNTLLTAQEPPYLIAVPPGLGISVVREADEMPVPPRSRYLLLDDSAFTHFRRPLHVQPLATLPYGTLCLNLESGCDPRSLSVNRSTEGRSGPTVSRSNRDEPTREASPR